MPHRAFSRDKRGKMLSEAAMIRALDRARENAQTDPHHQVQAHLQTFRPKRSYGPEAAASTRAKNAFPRSTAQLWLVVDRATAVAYR